MLTQRPSGLIVPVEKPKPPEPPQLKMRTVHGLYDNEHVAVVRRCDMESALAAIEREGVLVSMTPILKNRTACVMSDNRYLAHWLGNPVSWVEKT